MFKPVVTTPDAILQVCREANSAPSCIGLVAWMHTFSPAKMWIAGLSALTKPFAHLHTQYNRDIPWAAIDMDFMNLNQSAHGDREFGFIGTRMRRERKVIVGHWQEKDVQQELAVWMRAACAWHDAQELQRGTVRRQHARGGRDRGRQGGGPDPIRLLRQRLRRRRPRGTR